jgi:hypothetical protein
MAKAVLVLGGILGAVCLASAAPATAAELYLPSHAAHGRAPQDCGPCGCLSVEYVYHRELRSTYGLSYDPRNFDTAEPYYFLGPIRRYPRYFVEGWSADGSCPS